MQRHWVSEKHSVSHVVFQMFVCCSKTRTDIDLMQDASAICFLFSFVCIPIYIHIHLYLVVCLTSFFIYQCCGVYTILDYPKL